MVKNNQISSGSIIGQVHQTNGQITIDNVRGYIATDGEFNPPTNTSAINFELQYPSVNYDTHGQSRDYIRCSKCDASNPVSLSYNGPMHTRYICNNCLRETLDRLFGLSLYQEELLQSTLFSPKK